MKWNAISRRHFLQGAGATLALPLLPSLMSKKAWAQAAPVQKSFIGIANFNGLFRMLGPNSMLMPQLPYDPRTMTGFSSVFTPFTAPGLHTVYSAPLASLASGGALSGIVDASFASMLPKMTVMMGFDYLALQTDNHHRGHFGNLNANFGGPYPAAVATLDQVMANSLNFYKNPALQGTSVVYTTNDTDIGLIATGTATSATYANPAQPTTSAIIGTPPFFNPQAVWDKFFGSSMQTGPNLKGTLVDQCLADYKAIRNGSRISAADAQILDQHVAFLQQAETQVTAMSGCQPGTRPNGVAPSGAAWGASLSDSTPGTMADRIALIEAMNTVITALIACGLCNSFLGSADSLTSTNLSDWHAWSHESYDGPNDAISNPTTYATLINDNTIVMKTMALDLAQKLDAIKPDGVRSLLDNALIAVVEEHSKLGHQTWGIPCITFGSAGGALATGLYLDYRNLDSGDDQDFTRCGYPINQLWANWLQAVGVPASEYEALNQSADCGFQIGNRLTGYGPSSLATPLSINTTYQSNYGASGWTGYDLSSWLPFLAG